MFLILLRAGWSGRGLLVSLCTVLSKYTVMSDEPEYAVHRTTSRAVCASETSH